MALALRQLNTIHKRGHKVFFYIKKTLKLFLFPIVHWITIKCFIIILLIWSQIFILGLNILKKNLVKTFHRLTHLWKHDTHECDCFMDFAVHHFFFFFFERTPVRYCYTFNFYALHDDWSFGRMKLRFLSFKIIKLQESFAQFLSIFRKYSVFLFA